MALPNESKAGCTQASTDGKAQEEVKRDESSKRWRTAVLNGSRDAACDDLNLDCLLGDRL